MTRDALVAIAAEAEKAGPDTSDRVEALDELSGRLERIARIALSALRAEPEPVPELPASDLTPEERETRRHQRLLDAVVLTAASTLYRRTGRAPSVGVILAEVQDRHMRGLAYAGEGPLDLESIGASITRLGQAGQIRVGRPA